MVVTPGGADGSPQKVWSGAADGALHVAPDAQRAGRLDAGGFVGTAGQKAVKSMLAVSGHVWCGCEDGKIAMYSVAGQALVKTWKPHSGELSGDLVAILWRLFRFHASSCVVWRDFARYAIPTVSNADTRSLFHPTMSISHDCYLPL